MCVLRAAGLLPGGSILSRVGHLVSEPPGHPRPVMVTKCPDEQAQHRRRVHWTVSGPGDVVRTPSRVPTVRDLTGPVTRVPGTADPTLNCALRPAGAGPTSSNGSCSLWREVLAGRPVGGPHRGLSGARRGRRRRAPPPLQSPRKGPAGPRPPAGSVPPRRERAGSAGTGRRGGPRGTRRPRSPGAAPLDSGSAAAAPPRAASAPSGPAPRPARRRDGAAAARRAAHRDPAGLREPRRRLHQRGACLRHGLGPGVRQGQPPDAGAAATPPRPEPEAGEGRAGAGRGARAVLPGAGTCGAAGLQHFLRTRGFVSGFITRVRCYFSAHRAWGARGSASWSPGLRLLLPRPASGSALHSAWVRLTRQEEHLETRLGEGARGPDPVPPSPGLCSCLKLGSSCLAFAVK